MWYAGTLIMRTSNEKKSYDIAANSTHLMCKIITQAIIEISENDLLEIDVKFNLQQD